MSPDVERADGDAGGTFAWNPKVACRTLDDTAFILLNSKLVRLNEVGTRIWELFEDGSTVEAVVARIVEEFDTTEDEATTDARAFVGALVHKELLVEIEDERRAR